MGTTQPKKGMKLQSWSILMERIHGGGRVCNILDPPIGEEDATKALTIQATSPMNM